MMWLDLSEGGDGYNQISLQGVDQAAAAGPFLKQRKWSDLMRVMLRRVEEADPVTELFRRSNRISREGKARDLINKFARRS